MYKRILENIQTDEQVGKFRCDQFTMATIHDIQVTPTVILELFHVTAAERWFSLWSINIYVFSSFKKYTYTFHCILSLSDR